ncbi:MAG: GvpL/GvpF family gas vesicle protein [Gemmatimonadota bacterium]
MGLYGYCVVARGLVPISGISGLDDAEVTAHAIDDLAVLVSSIARPEPSIEHVQQHNAVVEAVVTEEVTPVPLRFGQWSEDLAIFENVIRQKADWYRERLARFAGAMEFGLRILRPDRDSSAQVVRVPRATTGLEYMKGLRERVEAERAEHDDVEQVRAGVSEVLGGLVREERVEEARTPHGVVTIAHLVSRKDFDLYRERAQALRARFPELRFLVSGPWVPYSFAA